MKVVFEILFNHVCYVFLKKFGFLLMNFRNFRVYFIIQYQPFYYSGFQTCMSSSL